MALAADFQAILDSLPADWTDLELDLRIVDESPLHRRPRRSSARSTPSRTRTASRHWRILVAPTASATPRRRRQCHGTLKLLDDAGASRASWPLREVRSRPGRGRADVGPPRVGARRSSAAKRSAARLPVGRLSVGRARGHRRHRARRRTPRLSRRRAAPSVIPNSTPSSRAHSSQHGAVAGRRARRSPAMNGASSTSSCAVERRTGRRRGTSADQHRTRPRSPGRQREPRRSRGCRASDRGPDDVGRVVLQRLCASPRGRARGRTARRSRRRGTRGWPGRLLASARGPRRSRTRWPPSTRCGRAWRLDGAGSRSSSQDRRRSASAAVARRRSRPAPRRRTGCPVTPTRRPSRSRGRADPRTGPGSAARGQPDESTSRP